MGTTHLVYILGTRARESHAGRTAILPYRPTNRAARFSRNAPTPSR